MRQGFSLQWQKAARKIFVMGHPEYDRVTLDGEYKRDLAKGPADRNPGELLPGRRSGKQTAAYVESTCEQPVYKLAELLRIPEQPRTTCMEHRISGNCKEYETRMVEPFPGI